MVDVVKEEDAERRHRLAVATANRLTYPFRELKEGKLHRSDAHLRNVVADRMLEFLLPNKWLYGGVEYSVQRVSPSIQPDGRHIMIVSLVDDDGAAIRIPLHELMDAQ